MLSQHWNKVDGVFMRSLATDLDEVIWKCGAFGLDLNNLRGTGKLFSSNLMSSTYVCIFDGNYIV